MKQWEELEEEIEKLHTQYIAIQNELVKEVLPLKVNWHTLIEGVWYVVTSRVRFEREIYFKASSVTEIRDSRFTLKLVMSDNADMLIGESASKEKAESTAAKVDTLIHRHINSPQMKQLVKHLELVNGKQQSFREEILRLANSIRLGRLLEGKCRDCPRY